MSTRAKKARPSATPKTTPTLPALSESEARDLCELTALPSASGCESAVVGWLLRWADARPGLKVTRDRYGAVLIHDASVKPKDLRVIMTAHMDHPAFVVESIDGQHVVAAFRGGVRDSYFVGSAVRGWRVSQDDGAVRGPRGVVTQYRGPKDIGEERDDARVTLDFGSAKSAGWLKPGDVVTWDTGKTRISGKTTKSHGKLHTLACDNLAGAAAALAGWDRMRSALKHKDRPHVKHVGVLFSRAEEIGFVGAIGACQSGLVPKKAVVVVLENSMALPEAPVGGGPIVRVGDRTSVFDPGTTYALCQLAEEAAMANPGWAWQRKLMTGGTCEATAYQALGWAACCLCLPLANYHNMNVATGKIAAESINLNDYAGLVALLAQTDRLSGDELGASALQKRLENHFERRSHLLKSLK